MKRIALLLFVLCGCTSGPLPKSYAVILDPSLGDLASGVHTAVHDRLPAAEFMDSVLPADKHEAIVLIRAGLRPAIYVYEVYRGDKVVRRGVLNEAAPRKLAARIARDLRRL